MSKKRYMVGFKGKETSLFDHNGAIIRKFKSQAEVVNAQIDYAGENPTVAITMKNGKYELYKVNGQLIKRN